MPSIKVKTTTLKKKNSDPNKPRKTLYKTRLTINSKEQNIQKLRKLYRRRQLP